MKQSNALTDDAALSAIKCGDIVHVLARVVDVHDDGATVDIIGARSRFRVHPRLSLIAAVEPHVDGDLDIIETLCGAQGRVVAGDLMQARRAGPPSRVVP